MVARKIVGAQERHVVMSLEHVAANQQESDRNDSNSVIAERSLLWSPHGDDRFHLEPDQDL
jgi:hypothetical protein